MCLQFCRQVKGCLSAKLNDDSITAGLLIDLEYVFEGEGFEEEFVRGVVIGGNGFGVGVDHDGLVTGLAQGEGCVYATVIKFNALTNPIGATAEDHDLLAIAVLDFVFGSVGGIVVGRVGGKFCGTGIDQPVLCINTEIQAFTAYIFSF